MARSASGARPRRPRSPLREHLRDTLWFAPLASMIFAWVAVVFALIADATVVDIAHYDDNPEALADLASFSTAARSIISTITSAMLTFVGVVFSISLVALQMASSQFSPRVLRYWHIEPNFDELPEAEGIEVRYSGRSGALQDVNLPRLIRLARLHKVVIEVLPEVGDFLTTGTPVFRVHGRTEVRTKRMLTCLTVGTERSMHQDVGFGLRQLTDIAIRALSPAVNDPTTAVAAIDRLHQILAYVITEADSATAYRDRAGRLRVVIPEPNVAGMVAQAFTEIRICGVGAPQVTRRLSAALDDLEQIALPEHVEPLAHQRRLLTEGVAEHVDDTERREFALTPDRQGIS